mgnify:CR=1 FL=1
MKTMIRNTTLLLTVLLSTNLFAQTADRQIEVSKPIHGWDNKNFAVSWYNDKEVFNIGSFEICSIGKVLDIKMSPTGTTFALLYAKGQKREVAICSYINGKIIHSFRTKETPTAIAHTANAKNFCVGDMSRNIYVFSTSDYSLVKTLPVTVAPKKIAISSNNYFVAISDEQLLYVINFETGRVRKVLELESAVNHITFSPDNEKMAVLTDQGKLHFYETRSFNLTETYDGMRDSRECLFHPEGKYIAVITATDNITIINMKNPSADRQYVESAQAGIKHLGFAKTVDNSIYLAYNAGNYIKFHPIDDLVPDYQHLVALSVEEKMDDWLKQMPGETLEQYALRVNEETRAQQYAMFENEVATEMAGDKIAEAEVSFGSYNQEQNMLEINFDNMPNIYLEVPQEDVAEFSNVEKLTFDNTVYGVTKDDNFELLYTEVTNTETGKKYVFDNLEKQSLEYLSMNDDFVPLDLIKQSSMEEVRLQEIKQEVVNEAQQASLISEHTHIDVKTKVEASTNADGEKIMNYAVEFNYDVEQAFSAKEDFMPGKYIISQSQSAMAMLRIIKNAFANEFKQYIKEGKKVNIQISGSADAARVKSKIPYGEEYGAFNDALVYDKGELTTLTINSSTGITSNEQLAFLRAMGVKDYVQKNIPELNSMQTDYDYYINVSASRGAKYRRIGIKFVFIDAF